MTPSEPCQSLQTYYQLEPEYEVNSAAIKLPINTVTSIKYEQILEQKAVDKIDWVRKECSEVAGQLWSESGDHIRVLNIEHQKLELDTNITQTFDLLCWCAC